jgi:hypothetical protein
VNIIIAEHSKTSTIMTIMIAATGALRRGGHRTDSKITVTERMPGLGVASGRRIQLDLHS